MQRDALVAYHRYAPDVDADHRDERCYHRGAGQAGVLPRDDALSAIMFDDLLPSLALQGSAGFRTFLPVMGITTSRNSCRSVPSTRAQIAFATGYL